MAKAKTKITPECSICFDEEGSYGCVKPAHASFSGTTKPVTNEVLATAILTVSSAATKLYASGLNYRAVVALIADDTKLGKKTIEKVLDSLASLKSSYTNEPKKKGDTFYTGPR